MGTKEKKTAAQLVTLVMDKIREYPEYDHIAKVAVTRRIPRTSGHANWTVEWSVIGNWSVPEGAYKIVERLCPVRSRLLGRSRRLLELHDGPFLEQGKSIAGRLSRRTEDRPGRDRWPLRFEQFYNSAQG
jgi:hypothetical protein